MQISLLEERGRKFCASNTLKEKNISETFESATVTENLRLKKKVELLELKCSSQAKDIERLQNRIGILEDRLETIRNLNEALQSRLLLSNEMKISSIPKVQILSILSSLLKM